MGLRGYINSDKENMLKFSFSFHYEWNVTLAIPENQLTSYCVNNFCKYLKMAVTLLLQIFILPKKHINYCTINLFQYFYNC